MLSQADVVCRQLGFLKAKAITEASKFGLVTPKNSYASVVCLGNETSIDDCETDIDLCSEKQGAGVVCEEFGGNLCYGKLE